MTKNMTSGGVQYDSQIGTQTIYLDFDGELTDYNGEILSIRNVEVKKSGLSSERIENIVAALNAQYASKNVLFVIERPAGGEYSTIFVGKSEAFSSYGSFAGLAETVDAGNENKSDKAFVLLDAESADSDIIGVISHEADHLLGELVHGGSGLQAYAAETSVGSGVISAGLTLEQATVNVQSGGKVINTLLKTSSVLNIYGGGVASQTTVNPIASMTILQGGSAFDTTVAGGNVRVSSGGILDVASLSNNGTVNVFSGAKATDITVESGGKFNLGSASGVHGGSAVNTVVNSMGSMWIFARGKADGVVVNSGGNIIVSSGGSGSNLTVNNGGCIQIAVTSATYVQGTVNGMAFLVDDGYVSNYTVHSKCKFDVYAGASADCITLLRGSMTLSGGRAAGTVVSSGGQLRAAFGGFASDTMVNSGGKMYVSSGGSARDTVITGNGSMLLYSTGIHRGTLTLSKDATVTVNSGGIIDFSLENRTTSDDFLISDLSRIFKAPTYTITVSGVMESGQYKLAAGADAFAQTITIGNGTVDYGSLSVNGSLEYNNAIYSLIKESGNLYLTVRGAGLLPPEAEADVTSPTNGTVTVTAVFCPKSVCQEYSLDGTTWLSYISGVVFSANGTVYFRGKDSNGNISEVTEYQVTNIDTAAPGKPVLEVVGNGKQVTVSWNDISDASGIKGYIIDVAEDVDFSTGIKHFEVTGGTSYNKIFLDDGVYYFRMQVQDNAGNFSQWSEKVSIVIDTVAPEKPVASADITSIVNSDVTVTAVFSEDSVVKEYSLDNEVWQTYIAGVVLSDNGTVYFRGIDAAGNISEVTSCVVTNIDKGKPELTITGNAVSWTNQDVVLTASANEEGAIEYFNGTAWVAGNKLTVSANGTYQFRVTDLAGNVTEQSIVVDKIDKVKPELTISGNAVNWTHQDVILTASANEEGIIEYFQNGAWVAGDKLTVSANGTYQFRVTDLAGNVTEQSIVVDKIDKVKPELTVTGNATAWTNQDVILTASANEAGTIEYFNGTAWIAGDKLTVSANGTYQFRVTDLAGNVTEQSIVVDKIDKVKPELTITGNATAWTNQDVILTAASNEAGTIEYYQNGSWVTGNKLTVSANGTYQFRVTDLAGNVTEQSIVVDKIDKTAPDKPQVSADITAATNKDVTVSAVFSADSVVREYSLDEKIWQAYTAGVVVSANGAVYFRGTDVAGNISEVASYIVSNIDKVAPVVPVAAADVTELTYGSVIVTAAFSADSVVKEFSRDNQSWQVYTAGIVLTENGTVYFRSTDAAGNVSAVAQYTVANIVSSVPQNLKGSANNLSWEDHPLAEGYVVEMTTDNFNNVFQMETAGEKVDLLNLPAGDYQWRVTINGQEQAAAGDKITATEAGMQELISNNDGSMDVFFAQGAGCWESGYAAQHLGTLNGWTGTLEQVLLAGKNKLSNIFSGSNDANILVLTDDVCGDALFVDDIYSALVEKARLSQIDEIRAGAGDDIVDLTSQRYALAGNGVKVYGGEGNDTIWANAGNNILFGDAGNDRLVGASGNDVLIGGSGNDAMHGGGGDDIFCFGANWGNDVVEQLAGGKVTLWFESGSENNWNASTMTYTDGANSVTVSGVTEVTLKFGGEAPVAGAFLDAASRKIFEDKDKGMLA